MGHHKLRVVRAFDDNGVTIYQINSVYHDDNGKAIKIGYNNSPYGYTLGELTQSVYEHKHALSMPVLEADELEFFEELP